MQTGGTRCLPLAFTFVALGDVFVFLSPQRENISGWVEGAGLSKWVKSIRATPRSDPPVGGAHSTPVSGPLGEAFGGRQGPKDSDLPSCWLPLSRAEEPWVP